METAGLALWECVEACQPQQLVVLAGPGNNGGDGYVVARNAMAAGLPVCVYACESKSALAQHQQLAFVADGGQVKPLADFALLTPTPGIVVVDALLGNGLSRPVADEMAAAITQANEWRRANHIQALLSADIPSGLQSDSGAVLGVACQADVTVTFIALKLGLFTGAAAAHVGKLYFAGLDVAEVFAQQQSPWVTRLTATHLMNSQGYLLPPRAATAHKGDAGTVLILGGGSGMAGAAGLAGMAALRTGAGKVIIGCHSDSQTAVASWQPELMVHAIGAHAAGLSKLKALCAQASVIVVGPGLGQDAWAKSIWTGALRSRKPLVIDADALQLLARAPATLSAPWVLTPHPGEAARLLGQDNSRVNQNRPDALTQIYKKYLASATRGNSTGVALLKGAGTLVYGAGETQFAVNSSGSPALASGGMGDVLSGVIAALLAQAEKQHPTLAPVLFENVCKAVWLHGKAAELAARQGATLRERGIIASDLFDPICSLVNMQLTDDVDAVPEPTRE